MGTAHALRRSKASIKAGSNTRTSRCRFVRFAFITGTSCLAYAGRSTCSRTSPTIARKSPPYRSSMRSGMPTKLSGKASSNGSSRSWTTTSSGAGRGAACASGDRLPPDAAQRGPCGSRVRDRVLPAARRRGLAPRRGSRHGSASSGLLLLAPARRLPHSASSASHVAERTHRAYEGLRESSARREPGSRLDRRPMTG